MCLHEFYLSTACGHHFPRLPPSAKPNVFFSDYHSTIAVPQSLTCNPVKLALKFYHDQVVYLPADMNCGAKVEIPKSCPIVHVPRDGPTKRTSREQDKARALLKNNMLGNGLGPWQERQIEINAMVLDQCSNRAKPGQHNAADLRRHRSRFQYPLNMYAHVQNVKAFQARDRRLMVPNVSYTDVDFGCGGPFSAECLTGWDGAGLLTHRLHLWGDAVTHPKPCNHQCLAGWSGADLDTRRQQIWAGDNLRNWGNVDYSGFAPKHVFEQTKITDHWVSIDYSNISHLHADQWHWNGKEFERIHTLPNGDVVHVPERVSVPVPESFDQVLRGMSRVPLPEEVDQASIEAILRRLPEAFNEEEPLTSEGLEPRMGIADESAREEEMSTEEGSEPLVDVAKGSESDTTAVADAEEKSEEEQEPTPAETPEMAEVRRQRARKEMREKIARDFSRGKEKVVIKEG